MPVDIMIFAAVAIVLGYKLYTVLGTRHGEERERVNPFGDAPVPPAAQIQPSAPRPAPDPAAFAALATPDGDAAQGLAQIAAADGRFDPAGFVEGAKQAFAMIVSAYDAGDVGSLDPLLSPKLLADFKAGIAARGGQPPAPRAPLRAARVAQARLAGVMAYVTVSFETEGAATRDLWTFARDIRSEDPNWTLVETRLA